MLFDVNVKQDVQEFSFGESLLTAWDIWVQKGPSKGKMQQEANGGISAKTLPPAVAPGKWARVYHSSGKKMLIARRDSPGGQGEGGKWEIPDCQDLPWLVQTPLDAV